jgi:hypothetical protein
MATFTLGNHTATTQTISGKVTLIYTGSHGSLSLAVPFTLRLTAGQTLSESSSFAITKAFPRRTYSVSVSTKDGSGNTAASNASLTIS